MPYYKAGVHLSAWIIEQLEKLEELKERAKAFGKECGATDDGNFYVNMSFGVYEVFGWKFSDGGQPKGWVRMCRNHQGAYRPGAKSPHRIEFGCMKSYVLRDIMDRLKMPIMRGLEVRQPGVLSLNGVVYLTLPEDVKTPKECERLTDVEYEKIQKKAMAAKR